jgi:hypothetical protein
MFRGQSQLPLGRPQDPATSMTPGATHRASHSGKEIVMDGNETPDTGGRWPLRRWLAPAGLGEQGASGGAGGGAWRDDPPGRDRLGGFPVRGRRAEVGRNCGHGEGGPGLQRDCHRGRIRAGPPAVPVRTTLGPDLRVSSREEGGAPRPPLTGVVIRLDGSTGRGGSRSRHRGGSRAGSWSRRLATSATPRPNWS